MVDYHRYIKTESEQIELNHKTKSKLDEQNQEEHRTEKSDPSEHVHHIWRRF